MQNIDLICIGKLNMPFYAAGVAEYQKRLAAFCNFRIVELPEAAIDERHASAAQVEKALEKEAKAILGALRKGEYLAALCVEGRQISSEELADLIAGRAMSGAGGHRLCHRLLPRPGTKRQARGAKPYLAGAHHHAPSAGPPGPDRAALPRLFHQRGHEIPQINISWPKAAILGGARPAAQDGEVVMRKNLLRVLAAALAGALLSAALFGCAPAGDTQSLPQPSAAPAKPRPGRNRPPRRSPKRRSRRNFPGRSPAAWPA